MDTSSLYRVNLDVFQGPMDLLLFLIKQKKIDIHDIPISVITREYLDYLDRKEKINLEREADFLVIAALLIHIKSQMLLPVERIPDDDDPRQILVDRLLEFQKIKAASSLLREKEEIELKRWGRTAPPPQADEEEIGLELTEISLFDLAEAFFTLMKQRERENVQVITGKDFSIEQKMKEIIAVLKKEGFIDFLGYLGRQHSLEEALGTFFCLLELVKMKIAVAVQENLFAPIKVWMRKEAPA